jgi:hypothetical protein
MSFEPDYSRVFFPNQITAANDIVNTFANSQRLFADGTSPDHINPLPFYSLLWAQVQSGKSGTFHCIARMMYWKGLIDHVYILCGSSETCLREQAIKDMNHYQPDIIDDFEVIFRQDFFKRMPLSHNPLRLERALFIIDESHMDQDKNQQLNILLSAYGLSLAGTLPLMREKNTFIVSVDATPYAELSAILSNQSLPKHIHKMIPGKGYIGPIQLLKAGRLHNALDIADFNFTRIADIIRKYANGKYAIFRTRGKKTKILVALCKAFGFDIRFYMMKKSNIVITDQEKTPFIRQSLQDKPLKTTVVIISGRLRAGKVVPKQHLGLMWESAPKSNTDVLIQGLWGRACGYYKPSLMPHIFLPLVHLVTSGEMDRYRDAHYPRGSPTPSETTDEEYTIPSRASNVKRSKDSHLPDTALKSAFRGELRSP